MNKYCNVKFCRYPDSHVTEAHLCGNCKKFGHGQLECNNLEEIQKLTSTYGNLLPVDKKCTINDCKYSMTHTVKAHHPNMKLLYDNNPFDSIRPEYILKKQNYNIDEFHQLLKAGTFIEVYEGMGCTSFIRKNVDNQLEGLFVHSDDWTFNPLKIIKFENFIKNFIKIETSDFIIHQWTGQ